MSLDIPIKFILMEKFYLLSTLLLICLSTLKTRKLWVDAIEKVANSLQELEDSKHKTNSVEKSVGAQKV